MTRREIRELLRELKRYFIKVSEDNYRVKLTGGERHALEHYTALIFSDEEIELQLLMELSHKDADLRYAIEERASIVWADSGEYDEWSALKELKSGGDML